MRRILHTAVGDEIRKLPPDEQAEAKMESIEYANEVRGFYDYDEDEFEEGPFGEAFPELEPDEDEQCEPEGN